MKIRTKKQRFAFKGDLKDDSILIGSHGDAVVHIAGNVDLSGIIYCPKYSVTVFIKGEGKIVFRGKCNQLIIKKMQGNCTLDISDLTCKELRCESIHDQSTILTGKIRVISQANLAGDSVLHIAEKPLVISSFISGSSKIIHHSLIPQEESAKTLLTIEK